MLIKDKPPDALKSDGSKCPYTPGVGYKFPSTGVWYVDVSVPDAARVCVHMTWDAVLAAIIRYEGSNLPAFKSLSQPYTDPSGGVDVALNDANTGATAGNWIIEDPTTAYVPVVTGVTVANQTLTVAGTNVGGSRFDLVNAYRRGRIRLNVTAAGVFRCHVLGQNA